jgi:hypothetical protein
VFAEHSLLEDKATYQIGTKTTMVEMTVPAYLDERGNPALSHEPNFLPDTPRPNDTSTPDRSAAGPGVNLLISTAGMSFDPQS